ASCAVLFADGDPAPSFTDARAWRRLLAAPTRGSGVGDSCRTGSSGAFHRRNVASSYDYLSPQRSSRRAGTGRRAVHSVRKSAGTYVDVVQLGTLCGVAGWRSAAGVVRQPARDGVLGSDG